MTEEQLSFRKKIAGWPLIDMHAHAFPDKIADKAVQNLHDHYEMMPAHNGRLDQLLATSEAENVAGIAVHSAATTPKQVIPNNNWQAQLAGQSPKLIPFGSIHPGFDDCLAELDRMESLGLKGIKFHSDFQRFDIDDPAMMPIYEAIGDRFVLMFHVGDRKYDYSNPYRLARVLDRFPKLRVIAAHFGGYARWDEAKDCLLGRDMYIDTSSSLVFISPEKAAELIDAHRIDRVLFGTDFPLADSTLELDRFRQIPLTDEQQRMILSSNGLNLLASMGWQPA